MSTRFEILKNGQRLCISGINGDGVLSVCVTYVKQADSELSHDLQIFGLGMFGGSNDRHRHAAWTSPQITVGDEISIRILPPGEFDEPSGMTGTPEKTIDDAELGSLNFRAGSWDVDMVFDAPPLESAHVHICADENGPTTQQRLILRELPTRHRNMWPEIRSALVRCHPEIQTSDELSSRLVPQVGINLYDESNAIELTYRVDGDPKFQGYFVRLRNWEITEVYMAE